MAAAALVLNIVEEQVYAAIMMTGIMTTVIEAMVADEECFKYGWYTTRYTAIDLAQTT